MSTTSLRERFRPLVSSRGRVLAVAGAGLLVVLLVVLAIVLGGDDDAPATDRGGQGSGQAGAGSGATSAAPSSAAPPTSDPAPAAPAPEVDGPVAGSVDDLPPSLPQVGLDETAAVGDGVAVAVASVQRFQGSGVGPGNVAGPALRVTIRLTNGTADPVDLDAVAVHAGYGPDVTPAPDLEDVSRLPFSGTLAPGATAEGTYVFSVPASRLDPAVIEVGYRPGAPLALFVGPVA